VAKAPTSLHGALLERFFVKPRMTHDGEDVVNWFRIFLYGVQVIGVVVALFSLAMMMYGR